MQHGLVQAQLVRWTSGLLPSDLHPAPDALAPSAAPAFPSALPLPPGVTAHASSAAQRAQQAPGPKLSPPAGHQPAAVTLATVGNASEVWALFCESLRRREQLEGLFWASWDAL
eukprot:1161580-Pelagomonas_calceolata.AAC.5